MTRRGPAGLLVAVSRAVVREREAYEQGLRLTWEHEDDYDPLLGEIAAARTCQVP